MFMQGYVNISFDRTSYISVFDRAGYISVFDRGVYTSLFNMAVDRAAYTSVFLSEAESTALIHLNPLTPQKVSYHLH
jgi:hypothetical protein